MQPRMVAVEGRQCLRPATPAGECPHRCHPAPGMAASRTDIPVGQKREMCWDFRARCGYQMGSSSNPMTDGLRLTFDGRKESGFTSHIIQNWGGGIRVYLGIRVFGRVSYLGGVCSFIGSRYIWAGLESCEENWWGCGG